MEKWSLEEILKAMQLNMQLQMTYFAHYVPSMEIVSEPDVTVVRSRIPDDTFNYVLSAHFTEENAHDRIVHVLGLFKEFRLPFSWWVGVSDSPSTLSDLLQHQGLTLKEKNIGMYRELAPVDCTPQTSPLIFQRVESREHLKAFADILVAVGGIPQAFDLIYSQLPPAAYCGETPLEMHIAYFENAPVVTGILVSHADVAGIYYVATIPQQRKKGFGTAMMKNLLQRAKEKGYLIAVLQASHEGLSLYERLGFKRCCQFLEYAPTKEKVS
jgi:GNAT superfamily N-acetyltransferase